MIQALFLVTDDLTNSRLGGTFQPEKPSSHTHPTEDCSNKFKSLKSSSNKIELLVWREFIVDNRVSRSFTSKLFLFKTNDTKIYNKDNNENKLFKNIYLFILYL
jgi:hypothetical protein